MRTWDFVVAEKIETKDATKEIRDLVNSVTLNDCFDQELWKRLPVLVRVKPDGEVFPVRAKYDHASQCRQIGVNPLKSDDELWYALADVIAAKLISGKAPKITKAIKLVPIGRQSGLRSVKLRNEVLVDPVNQDFFKAVIEERKKVMTRNDLDSEERDQLQGFLKVLANSASYGIYAETNRQPTLSGKKEVVEVYGVDGKPFSAQVSSLEVPGTFSFPPIAACVTAAARLMLALLERSASDVGGAYAFCDTDSMAIVAMKDGGNVPCAGGAKKTESGADAVSALSLKEVDDIVGQFEQLNPYDRHAVPGSILKHEDENFAPNMPDILPLFCYAISAKRYALFNLDESGLPQIRKVSEHGLGHLLNPTDPQSFERDWIRELWKYIICTDALGLPGAEPSWLDRPAISKESISSSELMRPFRQYNNGQPYNDQIKPFNFVLSAHVALFGHPPDADPARFHLLAPYDSDPRQWLKMKWMNRYTGKAYSITGSREPTQGLVRIKTYRDVLNRYRVHGEAKSLGPDGGLCSQATRGLLWRHPVEAAWIRHVGKESNNLEQVQRGLIHDPDEVMTEYCHKDDFFTKWIVPVLRYLPMKELMELSGLDRRTLQRIRAGESTPSPQNRQELSDIAERWLRRS